MTNKSPLTFYIELSSKSLGVGLNLALQKGNLYGDPHLFFFSLKAKMMIHVRKTKNKFFNVRYFNE